MRISIEVFWADVPTLLPALAVVGWGLRELKPLFTVVLIRNCIADG